MIIGNDFYLRGFTRIDKGEEGAIFVRYEREEESEKPTPEIRETPLYYGGAGTANYVITVPKPHKQTIEASAIVTRSSRKRYTAVVYDERRIKEIKAETLSGLKKSVEAFFEVEK